MLPSAFTTRPEAGDMAFPLYRNVLVPVSVTAWGALMPIVFRTAPEPLLFSAVTLLSVIAPFEEIVRPEPADPLKLLTPAIVTGLAAAPPWLLIDKPYDLSSSAGTILICTAASETISKPASQCFPFSLTHTESPQDTVRCK